MTYEEQLKAEIQKMNLTQIQKDCMFQLYSQYKHYLDHNEQIKWDQIITLKDEDMKFYENLEEPSNPKEVLSKFAVLKLNGGLGTSMKATCAKSLLPVRENKSFLEFVLLQINSLNKKYNTDIPLVLMNSQNTDKDTEAFLEQHKQYNVKTFVFNQFELPRCDKETLLPAKLNEKQLYYPPGHFYVYECLKRSPVMQQLIEMGIKYIYISNSDNLGATLDPKIANYIIKNDIEFLSEQTPKTLNDVKGGVLINYQNSIHLLETAQVPADHMKDFCDIKMFKYFHINNLYLKLNSLKENDNIQADLIVNPKTVNDVKVIQLEKAAGAAISSFNSKVLVVPRDRFKPVKKCGDLLLLMSSLYNVDNNGLLHQIKQNLPICTINMGIKEFQETFVNVPNLEECQKLTIGENVKLTVGKNVKLIGEINIPDNAVVEWKDNSIIQ